ncbi:uncharacterized protein BO97DRAFT_2091 [Aspergillus homomorphus CBS 101889]|uniref:Uncharacterized protein n=1 Tax=Aspergillus homomorphus (strain CBS 101889) TaxID=1450537 RepID=A0A395IAD2_ASPHC|nr:hypothetical protein BO97DRAFT_2091 [Aspergillus homomorphus CBS 101889]RAL17210.1 hypothetical protein BO97DRAFT_2091 [Aspergillus homomorphus CBS 101889]
MGKGDHRGQAKCTKTNSAIRIHATAQPNHCDRNGKEVFNTRGNVKANRGKKKVVVKSQQARNRKGQPMRKETANPFDNSGHRNPQAQVVIPHLLFPLSLFPVPFPSFPFFFFFFFFLYLDLIFLISSMHCHPT